MVNEEYINKSEAVKKGYKRRRQGGIYRQSVLEKYCEKGWLDLINCKFSAEDRKKSRRTVSKRFLFGKL